MDHVVAHSGSGAKLCLGGKDVGQLSFLHHGTSSEISSAGDSLLEVLDSSRKGRYTPSSPVNRVKLVPRRTLLTSRSMPDIGRAQREQARGWRGRDVPHWEPRMTVIVMLRHLWLQSTVLVVVVGGGGNETVHKRRAEVLMGASRKKPHSALNPHQHRRRGSESLMLTSPAPPISNFSGDWQAESARRGWVPQAHRLFMISRKGTCWQGKITYKLLTTNQEAREYWTYFSSSYTETRNAACGYLILTPTGVTLDLCTTLESAPKWRMNDLIGRLLV